MKQLPGIHTLAKALTPYKGKECYFHYFNGKWEVLDDEEIWPIGIVVRVDKVKGAYRQAKEVLEEARVLMLGEM